MKTIIDTAALASADSSVRLKAIERLGMMRDPAHLPVLEARLAQESDHRLRRALRETIALTQLAADDPAIRIHAARTLGELRSMASATRCRS
jgi:HEAT repeat protein